MLLWAANAQADMYQAHAAAAKPDPPRAFQLYSELAELGHPLAQEILAGMYVNGEGVKRDNVLGYAWAKLSLENGTGEMAKSIVRQLEPHVRDAARARVAEVQARFGREALQRRLLPRESAMPSRGATATGCKMRSPANPDDYYPPQAREKRISGTVVIEARVLPDGSAPMPRVVYSFPPGAFDAPARAVALASTFTPEFENGVAKACSFRFRVKFTHFGATEQFNDQATAELLGNLKGKAVAGDPNSQLLYALVMMVHPEPDPDPVTTSRWLLLAAQAGLPAAQYLVADKLTAGFGWARDQEKAARWLELAGDGGSGEASLALASYLLRSEHEPTRELGFTWMRRAAENGHFEGRLFYAALLASWPDAARRDPAQALSLLQELEREFDYDPLAFEIRAAALAAQGNFKEAAAAQKRALAKARRSGWAAVGQQARLEAYQQGRLPEHELVRF